MIETYGTILAEMGRRFPEMIVIDAGLATSMQTEGFRDEFPARYFNLGIAEQNAVGVAAGLARRGFTPFVHSFANFLARRAHDQVWVSVAWPGCPVKLVAGSCGLFDGKNGASHLATDDLAVMSAMPGAMVSEPADLASTREILFQMADWTGPCYLRLRRFGMVTSLLGARSVVEGSIAVASDPRAVCTLVACGSMLGEGMEAQRLLADVGIPSDLVHVCRLRPFNAEPVLASGLRTGLLVTLENHGPVGGFGDAVARAAGPYGIRMLRLALPDELLPAGDPQWLLAQSGLDAPSVARRIQEVVGREARHVQV